MKKVLIITIVIILVGLGGFAVFYYLLAPGAPVAIDDGGVERRTFNPFGIFGGGGGATGDGDGGFEDREDDFGFIPRIRQISSAPVSGAVFVSDSEGVIRYIERGTGHVFETSINSLTSERVTNTTVPKIQNVVWNESGEALVIQYLRESSESVETFLAEIEEEEVGENEGGILDIPQGTGSLIGDFLPVNITDIDVKDGNVFYLIEGSGGSNGVSLKTSGSGVSQIFNSPISEWLSQWVNTNLITLTTKPSYAASGLVFGLNPRTESLREIFGGIKGLTTRTSPDGENILYSESTDTGFILSVYNTENGRSYELPVTTLPEKCIWSNKEEDVVYCAVPTSIPRGRYPDEWYQGRISFSDSVWKIDVETGSAEILLSPDDFGIGSLDMVRISVNEDENHIIFEDRRTSVWWLARIAELVIQNEEPEENNTEEEN